jgi:hypothetical protein
LRLFTQNFWTKGGYYTNEFFLGTITDSTKFVLEYRGLLDYGQYYAARTGAASQLRSDRRVLFGATGWHNPKGFDGLCKSQYHLIPRDVSLDPQGRVTFSPLPEIATLRKPGSRTALSLTGGDDRVSSPLATAANGSMLELQVRARVSVFLRHDCNNVLLNDTVSNKLGGAA